MGTQSPYTIPFNLVDSAGLGYYHIGMIMMGGFLVCIFSSFLLGCS